MPRVPTFLTSWVPGPPADNLARDRFAGTPSSAPSSVLIILERCFICRLNENILPPRKPRRKTLPRQNAQVEWLRRIWTAKKSLRSEQLKFLKEITKTHVQSIMVPRVRARFGCWFRLPAYWVQGETFTRIRDGFDRSENSASRKSMCFWREIHLDAYCDQRQTGRRRRRPIWVRRWKGVCFIRPNSAEWEINRSVIKTSSVQPPFFPLDWMNQGS